MAQLVVRLVRDQEVAGSNPAVPTRKQLLSEDEAVSLRQDNKGHPSPDGLFH